MRGTLAGLEAERAHTVVRERNSDCTTDKAEHCALRQQLAHDAEAALKGKPITMQTAEAAARAAFADAVTHGDNDFKPELGRRTLVRALLQVSTMEA